YQARHGLENPEPGAGDARSRCEGRAARRQSQGGKAVCLCRCRRSGGVVREKRIRRETALLIPMTICRAARRYQARHELKNPETGCR
ncbi:MAG: hypothetical protein ACI4L8_05960, partial [Candidatus Fimadaptatus sp.]